MGFLDDYEPVQARLAKFHEDYEQSGRVITYREDAPEGEFVFRAEVYRPGEDRPAATGWAHEVVGQGNVNRTSALENCETSAVGRALANAGYAPSPDRRASREEMAKSQPVEMISGEQAEALKARITALDAKALWKDAGLPALAHLPVDRLAEANALLDTIEGQEAF